MSPSRRVVDDRVFLLGLDELVRSAMKRRERTELLECTRQVTGSLGIAPADVPVEGYYAEDGELSEYFLRFRAIRTVKEEDGGTVARSPEFLRLLEVASSPVFGRHERTEHLLGRSVDPLAAAMDETRPEDWTLESLTEAAGIHARDGGDFSLVGLAARAGDSVVLTAVRESVILYNMISLGMALRRPVPVYEWAVDPELERTAREFVRTFQALFHEELPAPEASEAERYWAAARRIEILGRCVWVGTDVTVTPQRYYHWAVRRDDDFAYFAVDFWKEEPWTTDRYLRSLGLPGLDDGIRRFTH